MAMLSRSCVKSFLISFVLLLGGIVNAQNLESELEAAFEDLELLGLSVSVTTSEETQFFNFGLRDFDRNLPITNDTHFRIASISKSFTALGILKLVDDGLLDLDADISNYLGFQVKNPNFPNSTITTRMLLSHQSSLQDGTGYNNFLSATFSQSPIPPISELLLPNGAYYTSNMWRTETPASFFNYSNLNYGLLGTVIEAVSNKRFDIFMKSEILEPLDIGGSFNIQDLDNINDLAALYRFQNGTWQPQQDNFEGILPTPPDLSGYTPGTNGLYFSPQGGLRCTSSDLDKFLSFLKYESNNGGLNISNATLQEMKAVAWEYNGTNGNTYGGLFNRWGLGLHHANVNPGDAICSTENFGTFLGHPGEAYGLISDAFFAEDEPIQFSILINGSRNGYQVGTSTSFYTVEETIFSVLCNYFSEVLVISDFDASSIQITPNPTKDYIYLNIPESVHFSWQLLTISGLEIGTSNTQEKNTIIDVANIATGIYFLKVVSPEFILTKKIIIE